MEKVFLKCRKSEKKNQVDKTAKKLKKLKRKTKKKFLSKSDLKDRIKN